MHELACEAFCSATEAWMILSDAEARRLYDARFCGAYSGGGFEDTACEHTRVSLRLARAAFASALEAACLASAAEGDELLPEVAVQARRLLSATSSLSAGRAAVPAPSSVPAAPKVRFAPSPPSKDEEEDRKGSDEDEGQDEPMACVAEASGAWCGGVAVGGRGSMPPNADSVGWRPFPRRQSVEGVPPRNSAQPQPQQLGPWDAMRGHALVGAIPSVAQESWQHQFGQTSLQQEQQLQHQYGFPRQPQERLQLQEQEQKQLLHRQQQLQEQQLQEQRQLYQQQHLFLQHQRQHSPGSHLPTDDRQLAYQQKSESEDVRKGHPLTPRAGCADMADEMPLIPIFEEAGPTAVKPHLASREVAQSASMLRGGHSVAYTCVQSQDVLLPRFSPVQIECPPEAHLHHGFAHAPWQACQQPSPCLCTMGPAMPTPVGSSGTYAPIGSHSGTLLV